MKRYVYTVLIAAAALAFCGCNADEGTDPGTDSLPKTTLYQYKPASTYNADEAIQLRFAPNVQTVAIYYLAQPKTDKEAFIAANGEAAYTDLVLAQGVKLDVTDGAVIDKTITDMPGQYAITCVSVDAAGQKQVSSTFFHGYKWETVVAGTVTLSVLGATKNTELQICTSEEGIYRLKNLYKPGYGLKLTVIPKSGFTTANGSWLLVRVAPQWTGYSAGTNQLMVRDYGYYADDDSYVTDPNGNYSNWLCTDGKSKNKIYLINQYYAGKSSYGIHQDNFVPSV